jgi:hypothetical protein
MVRALFNSLVGITVKVEVLERVAVAREECLDA